jgi:uncharacterized protein
MEINLDVVEIRVLGCLIEKELATPQAYPLTMQALLNACNQRSNRDPVLALSEEDVARAARALLERQLVVRSGEGGRVPKLRHLLFETMGLGPEDLAILCELLVRGPQTLGELRSRAGRMVAFPDLDAVSAILTALEARTPPLVAWLPREPGRREARIAQTLSPLPEAATDSFAAPATPPAPEPPPKPDPETTSRIESLEAEVASLRADLDSLREALGDLLS